MSHQVPARWSGLANCRMGRPRLVAQRVPLLPKLMVAQQVSALLVPVLVPVLLLLDPIGSVLVQVLPTIRPAQLQAVLLRPAE
ncbi:MAG: hypothetical protein ABWZ98_12735 [Nakamurella sp.]